MWQVYGLKNCDTCRKARKWLETESISHEFRDLRSDGISANQIARWLDAVGPEKLINRRGTTWRGLDDTTRATAESIEGAAALCLDQPALMKRPIFDNGQQIMVGFTAAEQAALKA